MKKTRKSFLYALLYIVPKNWLSCFVGYLVSIYLPHFLNKIVINLFIKLCKIDVNEADKSVDEYPSLQEFFIRRLKPSVRPIAKEKNIIISPCDGTLSIAHKIENNSLIQAKGKSYSIDKLVNNKELGTRFMSGYQATLYLSPRDYHRFHAPVDGEIIETVYIPGSLWPVNKWAVNNVENLFCENERVITLIKEEASGKLLAQIAIGATLVGKIHLNYCDFSHDKKNHLRISQKIHHGIVNIKKGQELGRFMFGSTIILLLEPGFTEGFTLPFKRSVKMGETLGTVA